MDQRSCTIGVDIGTTTVKAVAFDPTGREIARAAEILELRHDEPGAAEQDPADVYAAVTQALGQAARNTQQRGYSIERVGFSAAMHSVVPVAADGAPLGRAMTWMDVRATAEARTLWESAAGKALYSRTGTPIHPMAPLAKLLWLRTHHPEVFAAAARFVSLKEWVWHQWFGEWIVDASIASATGLYNLRQHAWDAEALALVGLAPERLSTIVPTTYTHRGVSGAYLAQSGVTPNTVFNVGASDGVLANLGVGAIGSEQMVITIGTSCAVRTGSAQPMTDPATRSFCYVLNDTRYIVGGPSNSGGIVMDWLYHDVLHGPVPSSAVARADESTFLAVMTAAEHAAPDDLLFVPYVAGERAPVWDASAKGVCFGLQLEHTGVNIMRAAVEGILFNAYAIASGLFGELGRPKQIVASGKVLEPAWIRHVTADIFGIPVVYRGAIDASVMGAATLAEVAAGVRDWESAAQRHAAVRATTIEPSGDDRYPRKYARFQRLTHALLTDLADLYLTP